MLTPASSLDPESVAMIKAQTAKLIPSWPAPTNLGHSEAEYMTVQAGFVLASGERSIHDGMDLSPRLAEANGVDSTKHDASCGKGKGPWTRLA